MKKLTLFLSLVFSLSSFSATKFDELGELFDVGSPIQVRPMVLIGRCYSKFDPDKATNSGLIIQKSSKSNPYEIARIDNLSKAANYYDEMSLEELLGQFDHLSFYSLINKSNYTGIGLIEYRQTKVGIVAQNEHEVYDRCVFYKAVQ